MDIADFAGFDVLPESDALATLPDPWLSMYRGAAMTGTAMLLLVVRELFKDSNLGPDERAVAMPEMLEVATAKARRWLARAEAGDAPALGTRIEELLAAHTEACHLMQWAIDDFAAEMGSAPGDATKH